MSNYRRDDEYDYEYEEESRTVRRTKRKPNVNHIGKDGITLTEGTVDELLSWVPAIVLCFVLPPIGILMLLRKFRDLRRDREYRRRYEEERQRRYSHHVDVDIDFSEAAEAIGAFAEKVSSQVQSAFKQAQDDRAAKDNAQTASFSASGYTDNAQQKTSFDSSARTYGTTQKGSYTTTAQQGTYGTAAQTAQQSETPNDSVYEEYLQKILYVNERIKDVPVSAKIDRIGSLSADIFATVGQKPEKIKANRKFMDYYLPTTLKLLENYSIMEAQQNRSAEVQHAMDKVSDVLDTLTVAFEKHLDTLRKPEVMDVESEVSALESILAQDGLATPKRSTLR